MTKQINELTQEEIQQILFLSNQGCGRQRLITNLYQIERNTLDKLLLRFKS
jgi:hypothetical protein